MKKISYSNNFPSYDSIKAPNKDVVNSKSKVIPHEAEALIAPVDGNSSKEECNSCVGTSSQLDWLVIGGCAFNVITKVRRSICYF